MIRVTALTAGKYDPSSRFRIRQFIKPLAELGIGVSEHWPLIDRYKIESLPLVVMALRIPGLLASRFSDITWLGRELVSGRSTLEHLAGKKRVLDVDDAIWVPYPRDFSADIVERCDGVIAGNRFLLEHYLNLGARAWLVPMSVDTDVWQPAKQSAGAKWTIGWMGSWTNLKYLYAIEEPLADFLAQHSDSRLLVVCGQRPSLNKLRDELWDYAQWSTEDEVRLVQEIDVGLMPLEDSEWTRGKCGFKMLTYMATALPVIVSPVGVNKERLAHDQIGFAPTSDNDWYEALKVLYEDRELGARMGLAGRRVVKEHYSVKTNVLKLAEIFHEVAES